MDSKTQENFMYLFERVGEPLYFSPRGTQKVQFNVSMDDMSASTRKASLELQTRMGTAGRTVNVPKPRRMPDLRSIGVACPKNSIFCYFNPSHRKAAADLKAILLDEKDQNNFFSLAAACRDSPLVNPQLFVSALAGSILSRRDMRAFQMPAFFEIMPDQFLPGPAVKQAQRMARLPTADRTPILLNKDTTGRHRDPENKLWYFREDVGINSHHYHWHIVFPVTVSPNEKEQDRRGEMFAYMHHSMMARYEAERFCNGLSRVKPFNFDDPVIEEGYFGKLYNTNSGTNWGTRQDNTRLTNLEVRVDTDGVTTSLRIEDLKKWRDRIFEAIDLGYYITNRNGREGRERFDEIRGIDVLGNIIENSSGLTPHPLLYGPDGFHNMGHNLIALAHDPKGKHREQPGPIGDTSTSMRDPAFYQWHKYIDNMFSYYGATLSPYTPTGGTLPLVWEGIEVTSTFVQAVDRDTSPNILTTYWMQTDIDMSRGIDFLRDNASDLGPVLVRVTHLNYDIFNYVIQVQNKKSTTVNATVRIFMAPRHDEHGDRFRMTDQRLQFFEMDKFSQNLRPGANKIVRSSRDSSVTIKWESSFRELENFTRDNPTARDSRCGCGWPQHMLLPKGTGNGITFDLVVFLTNGEEDKVPGGNVTRDGAPKPQCREALSFCGALDEKFPDNKPMGYPFDRNPFQVSRGAGMPQEPTRDLDEYVDQISNMNYTEIRIIHESERLEVRDPENMTSEVIGMLGSLDDKMETTTGEKMNSNTNNTPRKPKVDNRRPPNGNIVFNANKQGGKPLRPFPPQVRPGPSIPWSPKGFEINPNGRRAKQRWNRSNDDYYFSPEEDWDYVDDDHEY